MKLSVPKGQTIRVICSWCGFVIEEGDEPDPVSHGLCSRCESVLYPEESA